MAAIGEFNYLEFFKEELRNEEPAERVAAVNRMNLIASALGPQKTVTELLPCIFSAIQEEPLCHDEEILFSIAKQYAVLSEFIGGQDGMLIAPLEYLAAVEETVIRDQAILSLCAVVEKRPNLVAEYLVPALHRLATKADYFTARVSACAIFPTAYKFSNDDPKTKFGLRKAFITLCADDTPMVRRAAAHKFQQIVSVCEKQEILADLISVYKQLSKEDTQDTIRVACVHTTLVLAKMFNDEENRAHTVDVIKDAAEDRSWRVRLIVAKSFDQLCAAFGQDITATILIQPFLSLIKDQEQEVRKEAVKVLEPCLGVPGLEGLLQQHVLPCFPSLVIDSAETVRAALAQVIGPAAKAFGRDVTERQLLSFIPDLMKDEFHDVRLNIVSHMGAICEVLGEDSMQTLLNSIQNLTMDNQWRIRQSVVEQAPTLAKLIGVEMFQAKLEALFLSSLRDSVHSVRQAAITNLKDIAEAFGATWTVEHLLPKIVDQYAVRAGYANRVTTIHVLSEICVVMSVEQVTQIVIPLIMKATKDSVPNVRFSACRTLVDVIERHQLGAPFLGQVVKPGILELLNDSDIDVQFYAKDVLKLCP